VTAGDKDAIGRSVRAERERQGMDERTHAECARITPAHLRKIERGHVDPGYITMTRLIFDGLGMTHADFWASVDKQLRPIRRPDRRSE
jgi:transcriptional regulator with XRE-family HTH domain